MMASISVMEWLLVLTNLLLLVFSKQVFTLLKIGTEEAEQNKIQLSAFRLINALIIVLVLAKNWWLPNVESHWLTKAISCLFLSYLFVILYKVTHYFISARYGKKRSADSGAVIVETYSSRALSLLAGAVLFIVWLISIIQVLEFNSLLEAGGVVGFVGVMLGLTQSAWAPDIISGLIVLNSDMVEEGDVLELQDGDKTLYTVVYKTKMFHTELLDIANNHRVMLKNSKLRELHIGNLSKFASAKGLRESLIFKINYDVSNAKVHDFFERVEKRLQTEHADCYAAQHPLEVRAMGAGDYAVEWAVFYYLKNTRELLATRQTIIEVVIDEASTVGIGLATALLHQECKPVEQQQSQPRSQQHPQQPSQQPQQKPRQESRQKPHQEKQRQRENREADSPPNDKT